MQLVEMKKDMKNSFQSEADACWVRNTLIFRQWETMRKEILLHKWYESEKAGHDIGWERAAVDWMIRFGPGFVKDRQDK